MGRGRTMTNQEILEKAIQKAIDGGLTGYWADRYKSCKHLDEMEYLVNGNNIDDGKPVETLIFNHNFAKALWGEEKDYARHMFLFKDGTTWYEYDNTISSWQYHLQQMVIADDPIKYLGEHLNDQMH